MAELPPALVSLTRYQPSSLEDCLQLIGEAYRSLKMIKKEQEEEQDIGELESILQKTVNFMKREQNAQKRRDTLRKSGKKSWRISRIEGGRRGSAKVGLRNKRNKPKQGENLTPDFQSPHDAIDDDDGDDNSSDEDHDSSNSTEYSDEEDESIALENEKEDNIQLENSILDKDSPSSETTEHSIETISTIKRYPSVTLNVEKPIMSLEDSEDFLQTALNEMIVTESTYETFLNALTEKFYNPLLKEAPKLGIRVKMLQDIFENNIDIAKKTNSFIKSLKPKQKSHVDLSEIISALSDASVSYLKYVKEYLLRIEYLGELERNNNCHKSLERKQKEFQIQYKSPLSLCDLTLLPLQRIPRYICFVQDLGKIKTEEKQFSEETEECLQVLNEIGTIINDTRKKREDMLKLLQIQRHLGPTAIPLVQLDRVFICEKVLKKNWDNNESASNLRRFILFNDMFIWVVHGSFPPIISDSINFDTSIDQFRCFENYLSLKGGFVIAENDKGQDEREIRVVIGHYAGTALRAEFAIQTENEQTGREWVAALRSLQGKGEGVPGSSVAPSSSTEDSAISADTGVPQEKAPSCAGSASVPLPPVMCDLTMQGHLTKKADSLLTWRNRFFQIQNKFLLWWPAKPSSAVAFYQETPLGCLDLSLYNLIIITNDPKRYILELKPAEGTQEYFESKDKKRNRSYFLGLEDKNNEVWIRLWITEMEKHVRKIEKTMFEPLHILEALQKHLLTDEDITQNTFWKSR